MFVHNALSQDYCFLEAIESMRNVCDAVYVVDAGSTDGTSRVVLSLSSEKVKPIMTTTYHWHSIKGKEKLSYFTNIAIAQAEADGYEYVISIQADEVLHEDSYKYILEAVRSGGDAFMVSRINLWGSPYTKLVVPHHRKPCSTEVIRIAKSKYRAHDDAESIGVDFVDFGFLDKIQIYHMGFVRNRDVMVEKIRHMQADVFCVEPDKKLEGMVVFDPWVWFDKSDVQFISKPLPKVIQDWAVKRNYK